MKRPMRWYWAVFWAMLASYAASTLMLFLCGGFPFRYSGLLEPALEWWVEAIAKWTGDSAAVCITVVLLSTPSVLVGMLAFNWLHTRGVQDDGHLHCLKCGYILKGITEPRCPECGERI